MHCLLPLIERATYAYCLLPIAYCPDRLQQKRAHSIERAADNHWFNGTTIIDSTKRNIDSTKRTIDSTKPQSLIQRNETLIQRNEPLIQRNHKHWFNETTNRDATYREPLNNQNENHWIVESLNFNAFSTWIQVEFNDSMVFGGVPHGSLWSVRFACVIPFPCL